MNPDLLFRAICEEKQNTLDRLRGSVQFHGILAEVEIEVSKITMAMEQPKPRVNGSMLPKYQGQLVCLLGTVKSVSFFF